jgi:amidophosphoribosyltransferase
MSLIKSIIREEFFLGRVNYRRMQTGSSGDPKMVSENKPRDKCGVFAVYDYKGPGNAAIVTYLGLLALQHRGQESAGMAYAGATGIELVRGMGLVEQVFNRPTLEAVKSATILGHVRYSTTGSSNPFNAQPLVARTFDGKAMALAHNGNLTNTRRLHHRLLEEGQIFHTTSDTEIILALIFRYRRQGLLKAIEKTMQEIRGAYAAVLMDEDHLYAFRDPNGFRPLVIGERDGTYYLASETAALDTVGANLVREVEPGEIVSIGPEGLVSRRGKTAVRKSLCIFEYVYFARPDSVISGKNVHQVRKAVGSLLAGRVNQTLDMVIPSPDSGVSAAMGLAEALKLPLEWAVHRNPYLGRTFIEPTQVERELAVRLKFNPIAELVRDKRVAVVDDSLVRGTTARILTSLLRTAGAREVHLLIASPPYKNPCYYGIDIPVAADLAFSSSGLAILAEKIGADSITFAEPEDLYLALGHESSDYCTACFSGEYPGLRARRRKVC